MKVSPLASSSRPEIEPIVCTDDFVIALLAGTGKRLVISLSGVGQDFEKMPDFDFIGVASQGGENHVLLASDRKRTWLNDTEFSDRLVQEIEALVEREAIEDVVAIGNSMGAFMALVLPRLTRVDCVMAFAAQYSMKRDIVPEDRRWFRWRKALPPILHETAEPTRPEETDYYLFHGDHKLEYCHWGRFPVNPKVHHFVLKGQNHAVARAMKEAGVLNKVVRQCLKRKPRQVRLILENKFDVTRRESLPENEIYYPGGPIRTKGGLHEQL